VRRGELGKGKEKRERDKKKMGVEEGGVM